MIKTPYNKSTEIFRCICIHHTHRRNYVRNTRRIINFKKYVWGCWTFKDVRERIAKCECEYMNKIGMQRSGCRERLCATKYVLAASSSPINTPVCLSVSDYPSACPSLFSGQHSLEFAFKFHEISRKYEACGEKQGLLFSTTLTKFQPHPR